VNDPAAHPQPRQAKRPLAAFDFDGTLTHRDSFKAFLYDDCGFWRVAAAFVFSPGLWLSYLATGDRGALKARLLFKLLGPVTRARLEGKAARFASGRGYGLFRADARAEWDRLGATHERIIVTASPELLVRPLGEILGADRVIGTRLKFADGRLANELDGVNCRGEEKMCRLREAYGEALQLDVAYGDTSGDREMLKAARKGYYRVFKAKA
jgi:phosphatidylglycerophosphatase C